MIIPLSLLKQAGPEHGRTAAREWDGGAVWKRNGATREPTSTYIGRLLSHMNFTILIILIFMV